MCNIEEDLLCPHHDLSIFKILHQREKESLMCFLNIILIPWRSMHAEWVNTND